MVVVFGIVGVGRAGGRRVGIGRRDAGILEGGSSGFGSSPWCWAAAESPGRTGFGVGACLVVRKGAVAQKGC